MFGFDGGGSKRHGGGGLNVPLSGRADLTGRFREMIVGGGGGDIGSGGCVVSLSV